jgi:hypothetical protein
MEMQIKNAVRSRQLLRNMLVEDFLHGQGDDEGPVLKFSVTWQRT